VSTAIQYEKLRDLLKGLERQIPASEASEFWAAPEVRTNRSPVQAYALDQSAGGECKPVVVAIGGNYTQDKVDTPRDQFHTADAVEADLSANRHLLRKGFDSYNSKKALWKQKCAVKTRIVTTPRQFHFVMTNFCIWITMRSWQKTSPHARADLLENNPPLGKKSTVPGCWAHLAELAAGLDGVSVLWVAHGMHCEVFALFRQFVRSLPDAQWILVPNLAYHYDYNQWTFLR
jgi:hypothetical protein